MKKVCFAFVLFWIMLPVSAQKISLVNYQNLPTDDEFCTSLAEFEKNEPLMDHWTPDESWQYEISRADLVASTEAFEKKLLKIKKPSYDVQLLRLIVMDHLYNLNDLKYGMKLQKLAVQMEKKYPDEYRASWVYANALANSGQMKKAIAEYRIILETKDNELLPAPFFENYANACYLSRTYKNGLIALQKASEKSGNPVETYCEYPLFDLHLRQSDYNDKYAKEEIWDVQKIDEQLFLFSRLLGASIPINRNWKMKINTFQDRQTEVYVIPEPITLSDMTKRELVMMAVFAAGDDSMEMLKAEMYACAKEYTLEELPPLAAGGREYAVYSFMNQEVNKKYGGQKTMFLFTQIPYSEISGAGIESPCELDEAEKHAPYGYDRFVCPVSVMLTLDTYGAAAEVSEKWFREEVEAIRFE